MPCAIGAYVRPRYVVNGLGVVAFWLLTRCAGHSWRFLLLRELVVGGGCFPLTFPFAV